MKAKRYKRKFLLPMVIILGILLLSSGCVREENSLGEDDVVQHTPTLTATGLPELTGAVTPPASTQFPEESVSIDEPILLPTTYNLDVVYNHLNKNVRVEQKIEYQNNTTIALDQINLVVEANRFPGVFDLVEIGIDGNYSIVSSSISQHRLEIKIEPALQVSESIILSISYNLRLPEIPPPDTSLKPQIFGYTSRQTNLVDWYPFIPPYDEELGWVIHNPSFYGEFLLYPAADFNIRLTVEGSNREIIVAASSIPEIRDGTYSYKLTGGRNFVFSFSPDFIEKTSRAGDMVVKGYWFPFEARAGEAALEHTVAAATLYSQLYGVLPRESISMVQADFLDGMEFDGLFFLSKGFFNTYDGTPKNYLTAIAVHETAHQWFYALVANDQAVEPWLDEAMCTYSEKLYYAHYYPELVDWWWYFRVNYYEPQGVIDLPVYDYRGFWPYRDAVYLNGAIFLDELRQEIGDEAFFSAIQSYVEMGAGRIVTGQDFFSAVTKFSDKDLTALINNYFSQ